MIKIEVFRKDNDLDKIIIKGHAKYDELGKDIVCASVSSIAISSINLAIKVDESAISYVEKDGLLDISILNNNVSYIFDNMLEMFMELVESYPNNIKIKEK